MQNKKLALNNPGNAKKRWAKPLIAIVPTAGKGRQEWVLKITQFYPKETLGISG
jgi:hypothetical protein